MLLLLLLYSYAVMLGLVRNLIYIFRLVPFHKSDDVTSQWIDGDDEWNTT